jgi:hypothetical protein
MIRKVSSGLERYNYSFSADKFPTSSTLILLIFHNYTNAIRSHVHSCDKHPGCIFSNLSTSSFQIFFCKRWPSALLTQSGTQYSLILQPDSSFPWLASPATRPCKIVRLPTSAVRAIMARIVSCMILVKVLASRPKPVEQRPGATMFTTTPVCSTGHMSAN